MNVTLTGIDYTDLDTGRPYIRCSRILKVLDPDAFTGVDPYVMAAAQQKGTDLHVLFGLRLLAEIGLTEYPARPSGIIGHYYGAIEQFVLDRKPKAVQVEQASVNGQDGYAGTPDTECTLDGKPCRWLIDLKTGAERAVHAAQLVGGYKYLDGYIHATRFASLYIRKTGTYRLVEHTHSHIDRAWFLAGLAVLNGRRHHGIAT